MKKEMLMIVLLNVTMLLRSTMYIDCYEEDLSEKVVKLTRYSLSLQKQKVLRTVSEKVRLELNDHFEKDLFYVLFSSQSLYSNLILEQVLV